MLIEMASDLEALYEHYLARGAGEAEAARRAEERVLASPAEVHRLVAVHTSGAQRWVLWLSGRMRRELDRFLFAVGVVPVLALSAGVLLPRLPGGGVPGWAVLGIGVGIAALSLLGFRQLFLRRDPPLEELRRRLPSLLFLGMAGPAVGALGLLVHLFVLCTRLSRAPGEVNWLATAEPLGRSAALLGSSILMAIAAAILWFILSSRLAALEQVERALLLDE